MAAEDPQSIIEERLAEDDFSGAATVAIESYGAEIYGFVLAQTNSEQDARDVYSRFLEDLWVGLPTYKRQASFRAWAYSLARNARHRFLDRDLRKQRQLSYLTSPGPFAERAEQVRTVTAQHLRTENKDAVRLLRQQLNTEEQALLTLRVDRKMTWAEIAEALGEEPGAPSVEARYRKRFQLTKDKLRALAEAAGLLSTNS